MLLFAYTGNPLLAFSPVFFIKISKCTDLPAFFVQNAENKSFPFAILRKINKSIDKWMSTFESSSNGAYMTALADEIVNGNLDVSTLT